MGTVTQTTWREDRPYAAGALVLYDGKTYRARTAVEAGRRPGTYTGDWERLRGKGVDTPPRKFDAARRIDPRIGRGA